MTNPQIHLFNWQQNIESGRGDTLRLRLAASPENQLLKQKVVTSWTKGREEIRARRLCEKDGLHPCFLNVAGYKRFSFGKYLGAPFRDVLFNDPGYSIYWVSSLYAEYVTEGVITDDRMYLVEKGLEYITKRDGLFQIREVSPITCAKSEYHFIRPSHLLFNMHK